MKILIITNHSYMLYRFRKELIQNLNQEHEILLSMPFVGHEEDFMALGIRCIKTPMDRRDVSPADEIRLFATYFKLLAKEKPDTVITYSIKPNTYAGLCCRMLGIPYYANIQGLGTAFQMPGLEPVVTWLYKQALRNVQMVFFENQSDASVFIDKGIVPDGKQTVLPGAGINLSEYRMPLYPHNEDFHFLYLGRIMREKGINELFSAIKRLHKAYGSRIKLDIVGFFDDEDYSDKIQELEALGIARYYGFQCDPRPFYEKADCVIVPSYHEGMSNVLLESAAMGRPVITTQIPGCMETVDPDVSGYLCAAKDPETLYACMEKIFLMPRQARAAMGEAGHRKMVREFDREQVIHRIIQTMRLPEGNAI